MSAAAGQARKPSLWRAFAQPAARTMFFFGFSSGLPFLLVAGTLAFWLKDFGIVLKDITMIASAGMLYAFKFAWAPLLDHWRLPGFARLGRRRGWLLAAQLGVIASLLAMAALTPAQLGPFVAATLAVAFFGATQDIAVDAYRIEIAPVEDQGALVATYSLGYRIGLIVAGALAAIMADHVAWGLVYVAMAAAMLV
ncbi:MAG: MFS transporter, partial [Thermomonas sp.]